jgi:hypothetical protein
MREQDIPDRVSYGTPAPKRSVPTNAADDLLERRCSVKNRAQAFTQETRVPSFLVVWAAVDRPAG